MHQLSKVKIVLVIVCAIALGVGCNSKSSAKERILNEFDSVNQHLEKANEKIGYSTGSLYDKLEDHYGDPYLKTLRVTITGVREYLKSLGEQFTEFCGGSGNDLPKSSYQNIDKSDQFFIAQKKGEEVFEKLSAAQTALFVFNEDTVIEEKIRQLTVSPGGEDAAAFANSYFNRVPPVAALTILRKFENDIKTLENEVLQKLLKEKNVSQE